MRVGFVASEQLLCTLAGWTRSGIMGKAYVYVEFAYEELRMVIESIIIESCERPPMPGWTLEETVDMALRQLPIRKWRSYRNHASHDDIMCAICMEDWRDGDRQQRLPQCCHKFHADCIRKWTASQIVSNAMPACPMCKSPIATKELYDPWAQTESMCDSSLTSHESRGH